MRKIVIEASIRVHGHDERWTFLSTLVQLAQSYSTLIRNFYDDNINETQTIKGTQEKFRERTEGNGRLDFFLLRFFIKSCIF